MIGSAVIIAAAALVLSWLVWTTAVMVVVARESVKREKDRR